MQRTLSTSSSSRRNLAKSVVFLLGLAVLLWAVQFVFFPRYDRDELWRDYRSLPPNSVDVLFLGTSLVHANINPAVLWKASGVRAYDLSGSEQSLLTTLPYLDEALKTQHPKVVALDMHMFSSDNFPLSENQKRSNLTMMPLGLPKLQAISEAIPASEWTRYLIPLEQFHSRWNELGKADFDPNKWKSHHDNLYLGYRRVDKVVPQQPSADSKPVDEGLYEQNYRQVAAIIEHAQRANAQVLLIVGPSSRPHLHDKWMARLRPDIARDFPNVRILETQLHGAEMGLDFRKDYYDEWHLNRQGAEKYSAWLGQQIAKMIDSPRLASDTLDSAWRTALARYEESVPN
jgi:hypothetical protein